MTRHELDAIIQGGESYTVEFKRNVNSDLSKELAAFANSSGGRMGKARPTIGKMLKIL